MAGFTDFLTGNAGSIIGGLLGAAGGGSSTTQATQSRDPWGPAQPYMRSNLEREAQLQNYYQKTPFNVQQARGYSNLFGDINNFHDNVAPGLLNFANNGMTSGYQRATGGAVGSGGGYGGSRVAGGLLQSGTGPFSVNKNAETTADALNYLNNTNNPFANGAIPQQTTAAAIPAAGGASGGLLGGNQGNYGHEGNTGGTQSGGIGIGTETDRISANARAIAEKFGLANPVAGVVAGLVSYGMGINEALAAVNATDDPIGALATLQGWYGGGSSGGIGSNADSDGSAGSTNPGGGGISGYGGGTY